MTQPQPPHQPQQQHPGYRPGAVPPPPPPPQPAKAPYGEDLDEAGGLGDEVDSISLRDVASVRYVRYHEWMELVLGSAVDTRRIVPPKVIPAETKDWTFNDKESLEKRLKEVENEVKELENDDADGSQNTSLTQFYNDGIAKLREQFGSRDETVEKELTSQLESRFQGHSVVEKKRARRIGTDLGLPEPKEQPEAVTRHLEQQKREQEERERREQEEKQRKEQEEEEAKRKQEEEYQQQQQGQQNGQNDGSLQLHHNGMDLGDDPMDTAPDMMNMLDHDVQMNDAELGELLNMPHGDQ